MRSLWFFAFLLACDGGPTCEKADLAEGGPSCGATVEAVAVIDDVLAENGLAPVGGIVHVRWRHVEEFVGPDGRLLRGHAMPEIRWGDGGVTLCGLDVADRLQDTAARTSLAHEVLHCSMVASLVRLDGDPGHEDASWEPCADPPVPRCGILAAAIARLVARGL